MHVAVATLSVVAHMPGVNKYVKHLIHTFLQPAVLHIKKLLQAPRVCTGLALAMSVLQVLGLDSKCKYLATSIYSGTLHVQHTQMQDLNNRQESMCTGL
jgi:hypothetical protein